MEAFSMKVVNAILKVLAVLAAVAGIVYVVATYGDKIVAWAKKMLGCCCCDCDCDCDCDCECEEVCEEIPAEDEEVAVEEKDFEA